MLKKSRRLQLIDRQHGHAEWAWECTIQHEHAAWAWACACSMNMGVNMKHGNGHAACTWTCSVDMDMHMHTDMDMQHESRHAAWTWTWSMSSDMDIQNRHGHAAWTRTCRMDMHLLLVGHSSAVLSDSWKLFFHFCHPSCVQVADDGRPGLLLNVYLKRYLTTAVFTSRMMQKWRLNKIFRHLQRYLEALLHFFWRGQNTAVTLYTLVRFSCCQHRVDIIKLL